MVTCVYLREVVYQTSSGCSLVVNLVFCAMPPPILLPDLSSADVAHPAVGPLLELIQQQGQVITELKREIGRLKDEIAHLKGHPPKPKIRPS